MTDMTGPTGTPQQPGSGEPAPQDHGGSARRRHLSPQELLAMAEKVRKVELAISMVLRIGVVVSVLVITAGLVVMFAHHSDYLSISGHLTYKTLTSTSTPFPHSFAALQHSIARGEGQGIVLLGVLILILTPVLRVAVGVVSFVYEKDTPMALVTLLVLALLVGSFFLAGA